MYNLAAAFYSAGRNDEALPLFEETLTLQKAKLGLDHPDTLLTMDKLAGTYLALGKIEQAVQLDEQSAIPNRKSEIRNPKRPSAPARPNGCCANA